MQHNVRFPFEAKCNAARVDSPLRKGETVEVRSLAPEASCGSDLAVLVHWDGRHAAVPLSQLTPLHTDAATAEAIGEWCYWAALFDDGPKRQRPERNGHAASKR